MDELNKQAKQRLLTVIRELEAKRKQKGTLSKSEAQFLNTAIALAS